MINTLTNFVAGKASRQKKSSGKTEDTCSYSPINMAVHIESDGANVNFGKIFFHFSHHVVDGCRFEGLASGNK